MRPDLLQTVTRRLEAAAADTAADADLVRRFAEAQDAAAFAALVRRHGPMVWCVCRHLLPDPADADDAFQATFLALVRGAGTIRSPASVGAWLHGVAVRVATRAKRSAARRKKRERAVAAVEAAPAPVPDARWEAALAAVHAEVDRLPDALRTAFVMCELSGVAPADAAARLGWKPGTLSGRLTRARQALMSRLARRGLCPAAAGVGVACTPAAVPARLVETVLTYPSPSGAVPAAVVTLASGVTDMSRTKLLAAAVLVAGGLAAGAWARLVPGAQAQGPPQNTPQATNPGYLNDAVSDLAFKALTANSAWEFRYYAPAAPLSLASIEQPAAIYAGEGWEFAGVIRLTQLNTSDAKRIEFSNEATKKRAAAGEFDVLVFKRPARVKNPAGAASELLLEKLLDHQGHAVGVADLLAQVAKEKAVSPNESPAARKLVRMRALEAQITALQQQLDSLRKENKKSVVLTAKDLGDGMDLKEVMTALVALADARYGGDARRRLLNFSVGKVDPPKNETTGLTIEGDPDAVDWLVEVARKLKPGAGK